MLRRVFNLFLFVLPVFFLLFVFLNQTKAGTISPISVTPASAVTSAATTYTIVFTPQTNVPASGKVLTKFLLPSGIMGGLSGATLNSGSSSQITSVDTSQASYGILIFGTSGLTGGTSYTIKADNIINPAIPSMLVVAIATKNSSNNNIDGDVTTDPPSVLSSSIQIGTAAFKGNVTNPSGNAVNNAWVNIFAANASSSAQPQGSSTNYNGDYLISTSNVASGSAYYLEVFPPFQGGGNMISPDKVTLTYNGSVVTRNFQFLAATKTISGSVKYSDNNAGVQGATMNAFKMNGAGFAQTTTDSSGNYTLSVGGGNWGVMPQASSSADWAYGDKPQEIKFATDTTTESTTVNFSVDRASASITGRILKPNGSPVSGQTDNIGVGVFSQEGKGGGGQVGSDGTFTIHVPAGTYNFNIWAPPNSLYGTPSVDPITVKNNETKNLGDMTLVTKNSTITGSVKTEGGTGISGVSVNAFVRDGGGFSMATTDGSGNFSISVTAGRWMVMPFFDGTASYALNNPPQEVSVTSGGSVSVNFTVKSANSTINGTIVDGNGSPVSVYGYAFAQTQGGGMFGPGGLGGPIDKGSFTFKVPAGTYTVQAGLAPGSSYTPGDGTSVTIADGETKNINVSLKANDATITGSIVNDSGNAISGSNLFVFAISETGSSHNFQQGTISGSTYTINVAAGEWSLGYFVDPSTGYMSAPPDSSMKFIVTSGGSATKNIVLKSANSTISGSVTKPDGSAATGVWISLDNRETEGKSFFNGAATDSSGNYSIKTTAGTYKVRANVAPGNNLLSPAEKTIMVAANQTQTANFSLRQSDGTISGTVSLNGSGTAAFVYSWSDDGGFAQTQAGSGGSYSLSVSKGTTWHVGARYESSTSAYEAAEQTVNMTGGSATVSLSLSAANYTLPQALTTTFDSTKAKVIDLTDGTEINIPASALASSGNVTLTINPKASLPSKKGDKPIWYGYDFSATNSNGQNITSLNSSITITFPYTDAQLTRLGITANDLIPSYWDETTGTWKKVSNVTVNTTTHTVTISVNHFTDFALTANSSSTNTTTSTATSSSTSTSSGSSGAGSSSPDVYAGKGAVFNKDGSIMVVENGTLPWDSILSYFVGRKRHPLHFGNYWQVSDVYDMWFKSYFNGATIYPNKASILAVRYEESQLGNLPENSLRLAQSSDNGKTWTVLPSSVLDKRNRTVGAVTKVGGQYMLVAGYGTYDVYFPRPQKANSVAGATTTPAIKMVSPITAPVQTRIEIPAVHSTPRTEPTKPPSFWQRVVNFILGK